jgi:signal transduction histidine kinase
LDRERNAAQHLRQLDDLKNEFVAMVAHDLRSPMSVVSGFAETLINRWTAFDDAQKLQIVQRIASSSERLTALINDVLDVARIEAGELSYDIKPVDVLELVERAIGENLQTEDQERVTLRRTSDLRPALCDERRVWQIFTNVLSNAIKFSPPGTPIEVAVSSDGGMVSVSVMDKGPGIPEHLHEEVFERFKKLEQSNTTKGTGLGLYISRSMVEAQRGSISVDSRPGEGATFTFRLPAA